MTNKVLVSLIIILIPICLYITFNNVNKQISVPSDNSNSIIVKFNKEGQDYNLSLTDYLIGVVGAEMPATFNIEALKAQAIASRTYALYNINNYIINTTTSEQAYSSDDELKNKWQDKYNEYIEKISEAVNNTNNLVIKYDQQLIKSYYYAMSNGYTEDSQAVFNESYPYLNVISSSFDSESNNYQVTKNFSREDFCKQLNIDCSSIVISNIIKDNSNRVSTLNINNQEFSGITLRKLLNLRSTDFNINTDNNDIEITTKGYGHGVGMSQYGANYLANNGLNYQEILKYYYQNIEIDNY